KVKSDPVKARDTAAFLPPEELLELNNQGVAYMEQFDLGRGFPKAVPIFEEIVRRWPDWTPGKFNLAVAILNAFHDDEHIEQSKKLLREVLAVDQDDARAHYTLGFLLQYQGNFAEARPHLEKVCLELNSGDATSWLRLGDCLSDTASGSA